MAEGDKTSGSRLDGKVAVVTGAGRGIGRAHAMLLAKRGAAVVVCDVGAELDGSGENPTVAQAVVDEIEAFGGLAVADTTDLSRFDSGDTLVDRAIKGFGRIDIVINNAGLAGVGGGIETISEPAFQRVFAVNVLGTLGVARAAWPYLRKQKWGRVINTVSEVALDNRFASGGVAYGAAKAAVWSLTLSLAQEGRPEGVTVNALSPGAFTRMNEALFERTGRPAIDLDPIHVARVAAWLASDEAGDVSGRIIHCAGGQHREYLTARHRDTPLTKRIDAAVRESVAADAR